MRRGVRRYSLPMMASVSDTVAMRGVPAAFAEFSGKASADPGPAARIARRCETKRRPNRRM